MARQRFIPEEMILLRGEVQIWHGKELDTGPFEYERQTFLS